MSELVIIVDRELTPDLAERIRREFSKKGIEVVRIGGREVVVRIRGFEPQFLVPVIIGILGALGIGIVSIILGGKIVETTERLSELFIELTPLIALFTAFIVVSAMLLKAVR